MRIAGQVPNGLKSSCRSRNILPSGSIRAPRSTPANVPVHSESWPRACGRIEFKSCRRIREFLSKRARYSDALIHYAAIRLFSALSFYSRGSFTSSFLNNARPGQRQKFGTQPLKIVARDLVNENLLVVQCYESPKIPFLHTELAGHRVGSCGEPTLLDPAINQPSIPANRPRNLR